MQNPESKATLEVAEGICLLLEFKGHGKFDKEKPRHRPKETKLRRNHSLSVSEYLPETGAEEPRNTLEDNQSCP